MKREQILINAKKLEQLEDFEKLRDQLVEGINMWWKITTPKNTRDYGTSISDDSSRKRFLAWLENEITILKIELQLGGEK